MAVLTGSCAFRSIKRSKGIVYLAADTTKGIATQKLNIFSPRRHAQPKDVLVFIHGGNWNSGNRSLYSFLGSRMARKDVVTVIIDHPLSPKATYKEMAYASAAAVTWVKAHIAAYGGNPERIFISGHSSGGHLAALIALDNEYFGQLQVNNPIKGTILIDAAGLDMYTYLKEEDFPQDNTYIQTFTADPENWKKATPLNYLHQAMPPMLIYRGGKTYPSIKTSNEKFIAALQPFAPQTRYYVLKGKKHVPMILQFFWTWNPRYKQIRDFMQQTK